LPESKTPSLLLQRVRTHLVRFINRETLWLRAIY